MLHGRAFCAVQGTNRMMSARRTRSSSHTSQIEPRAMAYCSHMPSTGCAENFATIRYHGIAMISTVCTQKMFSERRPTASRKCTMGPWPRLSRMNSRMNKQACSTVQKDAQRPQRPLGQRDAVGGAGSKERLRQ